MPRGSGWSSVAASMALFGCILAPAPVVAPHAKVASTTEGDVLSIHAQAKDAWAKDEHDQALVLARRGLELAKKTEVTPRTLAMLHELEGDALWWFHDVDCDDAYESALSNWQKVPGARGDVARVEVRLANVIGFFGTDFDRAEALARHSMKLMQETCESGCYRFVTAQYVLIDVLEQQCRTAEASALLDAVEKLLNEHPPVDALDAHAVLQFRALISRDRGDLAGAVDFQQRGLAELERLDPRAELGQIQKAGALSHLGEFELARGNYAEAAKYVQRSNALDRPGNHRLEQSRAEDLHFAYAATRDPRLAEHDERHGLLAVAAGGELFPAVLPEYRACQPEVTKPSRGRLGRYRGIRELVSPCFDGVNDGERKGTLRLVFRVEEGRVVAVQSLGPRSASDELRCAAERTLGYEHPTERYSEFDYLIVGSP